MLTRFIIADNPALALKAVESPAHSDGADAGSVEKEWRAMTDVHQFFSLLKRHNLSRQQAFRLVVTIWPVRWITARWHSCWRRRDRTETKS